MGLQLDQNPTFQRREWRASRIGWVLLTAFVLAGLVGLLGDGPISSTRASGQAGVVTVEHNQVIHHASAESLTIVLTPEAIERGRIAVDVTGDWAQGMDVDSIRPTPVQQSLLADGVRWEWLVAEAGRTTVTIGYQAEQHGLVEGTVRVLHDEVSFSQFVMP
jgi:hypothetical protein